MRANAVIRSGVAAMAAGIAMNTLAWWVNGGMPVVNWAKDNDWAHHLASADDKLAWLWDRIALPFDFTVSVGDLVLSAGFLLLAGSLLVRHFTGPRRTIGLELSGRTLAGANS